MQGRSITYQRLSVLYEHGCCRERCVLKNALHLALSALTLVLVKSGVTPLTIQRRSLTKGFIPLPVGGKVPHKLKRARRIWPKPDGVPIVVVLGGAVKLHPLSRAEGVL